MSINPLTGCTLSPRVLWAEMLMGGQVYLIILTSLGRSLALQSTSGGETRWVWASLAGVWQERPVTDRSTPPLRPLSEAEVEESISCPQLPTAWPSTGGLWLPLFIHPCVLAPALEESLVFLCEKNSLFPLSSSWGSCFSVMSLPGSLFPWVQLAPVRNKRVAAPPGQGQPGLLPASQSSSGAYENKKAQMSRELHWHSPVLI